MKKILLLTVLLLVGCTMASAQWTQLMSFNSYVTDLKSYDGKLFVGGNFTRRNTQTSYWSATYDGSNWSDLTTLMNGSGIEQYAIYQNNLWATGSMNYKLVQQWDGSAWDGRGTFNHSQTGIYADGATLYVGSDFSYATYTTDGFTFDTLASFGTPGQVHNVNSIIRFGNDLIFAGDFDSVNNIAASSIARWDGSTWYPMGAGIAGGGKLVNCSAVYNGDLYIGGRFTTVAGVSTGVIAKWNGSVWSMVGTAITTASNGIKDMMVYNNELYVVGDFTSIGGTPALGVAKYNGSTWAALDFPQVANEYPYAIEAYNGSLYLASYGPPAAYLYKYSTPISAQSAVDLEIKLLASPNPSTGDVLFSWDALAIPDGLHIVVTDIVGHQVFETNSSGGNVWMERNHLPSGTYYLSAYHGRTGNRLGGTQVVFL